MTPPYQQFDPKTIETLKAASNQVTQADPIRKSQSSNGASKSEDPSPKQAHNKFAEEFVQKLAAIEQKKAAVDEEMAEVENLWSSLVEKKKTLESRRNELIKVKDKLIELDKEMNNALRSQ